MHAPLLRFLAPLAIVALCAAAPAPPAAAASSDIGGLDFPVPAATGAWSVSLRSPSMGATNAYALDSAGTAVKARIGYYPLDQRTVTPIQLSPEAVASIERAVASAKAAAWNRETSYQSSRGAIFGLDTLSELVPNPTADFATPRGAYTLTLAWRAPDGTIQHGQAAWNAPGPNAEPADALALAHTIGSAFGLLI